MKILIAGDISVRASRELFAKRETEKLFNDTIEVFQNADEAIVNLECAVTEKDTPITKIGPNLSAPYGICEVLKEIGVTLCAISNNHIFDYGKSGMKDTLEHLEKNSLPYTGFGENEEDARKNYYIEKDGVKVAIVNVCEHEYSYALKDRMGARAYDPFETNDDIVEAKKNADYVIVIYHGGKEHIRYPSKRLVKACRSMVKHGADVVLCQHSHCIGCEEYFEGGYILYGQGNFHFCYDNKDDAMWNEGLLVQLDVTKEKLGVELIPTVMEKLGVRLCNTAEKDRIIEEIKERSKSIATGEYEKLFADVAKTIGSYTYVATEKFILLLKEACKYISEEEIKECAQPLQFFYDVFKNNPAQYAREVERFGHFLDCEAHLDALLAVYPTWNNVNEKD